MSTLNEMTDNQLSEAFAVEVAGWKLREPVTREVRMVSPWGWYDGSGMLQFEPKFATDANQTLFWLQGKYWFAWTPPCPEEENGTLSIQHWVRNRVTVRASTFARAACMALIAARRRSTPAKEGTGGEA